MLPRPARALLVLALFLLVAGSGAAEQYSLASRVVTYQYERAKATALDVVQQGPPDPGAGPGPANPADALGGLVPSAPQDPTAGALQAAGEAAADAQRQAQERAASVYPTLYHWEKTLVRMYENAKRALLG